MIGAVGLAGCAAAAESSSGGDPAARVEAVAGSEVSRVILSELGAERLGVATEAVRQAPGGTGLEIPFTAVVYDAEGATWTFTNPSGHTYIREPIAITSIKGDRVLLSSGPAVGVLVVTVGVAELVGAEAELGA
jgi:hypothetical protein